MAVPIGKPNKSKMPAKAVYFETIPVAKHDPDLKSKNVKSAPKHIAGAATPQGNFPSELNKTNGMSNAPSRMKAAKIK
jgi:hypothetical protein